MTLNKKLNDAINSHINSEFASSYYYLSMSSYCESINFPGFAKWLLVQSEEEHEHAMKFVSYLHDRGSPVRLLPISAPPSEFSGPLDVFAKVLEHERKVTASIHRLYEQSLEERDYATQIKLQWFINEQVEEEKTTSLIVEQIKMLPEKSAGIFQIDKMLGKRTRNQAQ